ncbi:MULTISPECIES: hypothetical protein [Salinibaculum]|uniref:hypothetical protein n=1 Tax=Salinibaculum TaxID=2732368 RepID=UPI0030CE6630
MKQEVYAVEKRTEEGWTVVGGRVFATQEAAEHFEEKYVEDDLSGTARSVDIRITEYRVDG